MASPDQMATGMKVVAKGVQVQSSLTEAQKQQDSSLTCGGASSCMADWTLHFCGFFKDCLVTPKHVREIFDAEHLLGKGHFGLATPLKGWICLNFYIGLVYDVLEALLSFLSLELMSFLPGFISAVIYTTLGSYTWYWACIAGTNVGCCVLWIKLLVALTVINLGIQLLDVVRSGCDVVQVSEETGEESCDDNALLKFFRNIVLLFTCVPMAGMVYFGVRAYYARLQFGKIPDDTDPNPEPLRPHSTAPPPPPPPPEDEPPHEAHHSVPPPPARALPPPPPPPAAEGDRPLPPPPPARGP